MGTKGADGGRYDNETRKEEAQKLGAAAAAIEIKAGGERFEKAL